MKKKVEAMEMALKEEVETWLPKSKAGVFLVQYQDGGLRHRFDTGTALLKALGEWMADPDRSPYFLVRADGD
jgi:hypothetical protein